MKPATPAAKALIVVVHYRAASSVMALLNSLRRQARFLDSVEVIVVDNCSGEELLAPLRSVVGRMPNVRLLESAKNRGYFAGARLAVDAYLGQGQHLPDWVIVSNHDILIEDSNFLAKLFDEDPSAVGILAPRISLVSGRVEQNPFMTERPGRRRRFTMRFYSSCYPFGVAWDWLSRGKRIWQSMVPRIRSGSASYGKRRIYAAHGSFLILSRRFFEAGGYLDDQIFLFGEEIALGETCRTLGLAVMYEPQAARPP